jgi:hypothetical protein
MFSSLIRAWLMFVIGHATFCAGAGVVFVAAWRA